MKIGRSVKVTLVCGHSTRHRLEPLNPHARFGCVAGTGCGYRVMWDHFEEMETGSGRIFYNKLLHEP